MRLFRRHTSRHRNCLETALTKGKTTLILDSRLGALQFGRLLGGDSLPPRNRVAGYRRHNARRCRQPPASSPLTLPGQRTYEVYFLTCRRRASATRLWHQPSRRCDSATIRHGQRRRHSSCVCNRYQPVAMTARCDHTRGTQPMGRACGRGSCDTHRRQYTARRNLRVSVRRVASLYAPDLVPQFRAIENQHRTRCLYVGGCDQKIEVF